MALLSRPLRGTVRRTPDDHSDDGPPPMKRQRVQQEIGHRRRLSSPDCLDTTTPDHNSPHGNPRLNPSKIARPWTATRRARRLSNSSADSIASTSHFHTAGNPRVNGNGLAKTPRAFHDRAGPSGGASSVLLRNMRESPDPLDTISPTPIDHPKKTTPKVPAVLRELDIQPVNTPTTSHAQIGRGDDVDQKEGQRDATENKDASRATRNTADAGTRSQNQSETRVGQDQDPLARTGTERRSLRSTDTGSRSKSELAQYFYNYEQIISLDAPKPVESLNGNTTLVLIDDLSAPLPLPTTPDPSPFGNPLQNLHRCTVIELPNSALRAPAVDPLNEDLYFRAHRKFERQEKQLRNIERDRAQHEKQQLDRLLEDLRGQDWLRVMGLTGVHENEKSLYEPKRQILIQELVALVKKFQTWKDEERRRKTAKDKPLPIAEAPESQSQSQSQSQHQHQPQPQSQQPRPRQRPQKKPQIPAEISDEGSPLTDTPSTPPDPHDVDALAARQLHQEARSASAAKHRKSISEPRKQTKTSNDEHPKPVKQALNTKDSSKRQKTLLDMNFISSPNQTPLPPPPPPPPPPPEKPFTSFFQDRSARDSAVAVIDGIPHSRTQSILAFGHPIPEAEEQDFEPPPEILTEEAIYSSRRQMRRLKRQSRG